MVNANQKGKRGERELVHFLRDRGIEARRSQQYCGKAGDSDVLTPGLAYHWEVKRTEKLRIKEAIEQARQDASPGHMPIVAWKRNHGEWIAILRMEDLIGLIQLEKSKENDA